MMGIGIFELLTLLVVVAIGLGSLAAVFVVVYAAVSAANRNRNSDKQTHQSFTSQPHDELFHRKHSAVFLRMREFQFHIELE